MEFTPDLTYHDAIELFAEHGVSTPRRYAKEAYDRTECGVWTTFLLDDGTSVPENELSLDQDRLTFARDRIVGIVHGTIVEGSDAAYTGEDLRFPFTDEQLAAEWQACECFVDEQPQD